MFVSGLDARLELDLEEPTNVCGLDARLDLVELMKSDEKLDFGELTPSSMFKQKRILEPKVRQTACTPYIYVKYKPLSAAK